ncbi:unnamed protein product [Vitrella brassicaformis CCMP3155]|uniref:Vacuolar protein sorting protein 11 C-terminal domain-containing protein n=1 Tax=Vitrella brassicaformis (strain CCMP3155) TaxID=1169540 RepID=A0A0G4G7S7_VITBC|nr:unnamed protein product [Vitrella brassicaformis CCMP3155]|eukprot:CEM24760.1 unnamed protein product [Vitrella brassicaformis CCMP3155]
MYCPHFPHVKLAVYSCDTSKGEERRTGSNRPLAIVVREQREAQAKNSDEFFKFLRGSPDGFAHVAEYFGRGLFPQQLTRSDMTAAAEPTQPPSAPSPFLSSMMGADMPPPSPS